MSRPIKTFSDGSFLEYDAGRFDPWCVYLTRKGSRWPPRDVDYFNQLKALAEKYGSRRVYDDFVRIYDLVGKEKRDADLAAVSQIAAGYGEDALEVDIIFSVLYLAMIAEENKKNSRLGKRIKRLGVHQLLMEGQSVGCAANFMRRMGWREIDRLCKERGF